MANPSPLRYPGGKYKTYNFVRHLIQLKKLRHSTYIEPFCGGAAVALELLLNDDVKKIIINDFDKSIYAFWYSVLNYTDELCEMIRRVDVTIDEWYKQKKVQKNKENEELLNLGFSTLFLNRTNRSGIIKAGVIGGIEQLGKYKIDCRFNKQQLIDKIRTISFQKERIEIYNLDTEQLIKYVINSRKRKTFIFFDPPYFKKGSSLYTNFYKEDNHKNLFEAIKTIKYHSWIVTYDNVEEIKDIYKGYKKEVYELNYSVQKKYKGEEVIFYSRSIAETLIKEKISINEYL